MIEIITGFLLLFALGVAQIVFRKQLEKFFYDHFPTAAPARFTETGFLWSGIVWLIVLSIIVIIGLLSEMGLI